MWETRKHFLTALPGEGSGGNEKLLSRVNCYGRNSTESTIEPNTTTYPTNISPKNDAVCPSYGVVSVGLPIRRG